MFQLGNLTDDVDVPMYSFERPAHIVWDTMTRALMARGWTDDEIKTWLQSRDARHALDGSLGDALTRAAKKYAKTAEKI